MKKLALTLLIFLIIPITQIRAETTPAVIKIFDPITQQVTDSFNFNFANYYFDLATGDVNGDGNAEILIANGQGVKPYVTVYDHLGQWLKGILIRNDKYNGGINLTVGDVDGDGKSEIITTAISDGVEPTLKIIDYSGQMLFSDGFFPYGKNYHGQISVATIDINNDGKEEILTGTGPGVKPEVKVFNRLGQNMDIDFFPTLFSDKAGINVAGADLGGDHLEEIVVSSQSGGKSIIAIYRPDGSLINYFSAYNDNFMGGVNLSAGDLNNDGKEEIITAAGFSGGPHVKAFNTQAQEFVSFFADDASFIGGIEIASSDLNNDGQKEIITSSYRLPEGRTDLVKYIEINLTSQNLKYFQDGYLMNSFKVSTGRWTMPTPIGEYAIMNKIRKAYSRAYGLYMPYWMEFKSGYGIHELPEWPNGYKEGANHLGIPVSHGCVRLGVGPAKEVYDWVAVGDKVIIHK